LTFRWEEEASDLIELAFSKKKADDRKQWLSDFEPGTFVDYGGDIMLYSDFVNKELILFSMADNVRSIPSVVDGFKPSQRKVLFACIKRNLKQEIKVAQLAGYVSEHAAYHHGEMSLNSTIINMAQDYVGSNNINLLEPSGQFGTRLQGGKDSASPRYVFTRLEKVTRTIFHPNDDKILNFNQDDGQSIEPKWYAPILPMILVNGSDGIGTGWSSSVPTYNPVEIIANIKCLMEGREMEDMKPYFRGFCGEVEEKTGKDRGNFVTRGTWEEIDEDTVRITELPIRTWTQTYKAFLEAEMNAGVVKQFNENHTDTKVDFTVTFMEGKMRDVFHAGFAKKMKMESSISTTNMVLFDKDEKIRKYRSVLDIIQDFYDLRLELYSERKNFIVNELEHKYKKISSKVRFILAVINGEFVVNNRAKAEILQQLQDDEYDAFPPPSKQKDAAAENTDDEGDDMVEKTSSARDFDYLLSMKIWSLTMEQVEKLTKEQEEAKAELETIRGTSTQELWQADLAVLEEVLEEIANLPEDAVVPVKKSKTTARSKAKAVSKPKVEPKKKAAPKKEPEQKKITSMFDMEFDDVDSEQLAKDAEMAFGSKDDNDDSVYDVDNDSDEDFNPAPKTKKQTAKKPPVKKAPKKKVVESDADSEDDVSGTSVGCACACP
jgi:DNA topoisomerase-2